MRVLFLDIDGVCNSEASFRYWHREIKAGRKAVGPKEHSGHFWCPILTNNLRVLFETMPEDVTVVISSCWRLGRKTLDELRQIFDERDVDSSRVIGRTGPQESGGVRGMEIQAWLDEHPEVTEFLILDDDSDMAHLMRHLVKTESRVGLTLPIVFDIVKRFKTRRGTRRRKRKLPATPASTTK